MESNHRFKRSPRKIDFFWMIMIGRLDSCVWARSAIVFLSRSMPILYHLFLYKALFRLHRLGVEFHYVLSLPIILTILLGSISVNLASSCFFTRVIESALIEGTLYQRHSYKRNKERLICYCNPSKMKTAVFGRYSARRSNNTKMGT
jgi:hypothetical protein